MRAILLACVLPFADGLRPMVARTVARPALAVRPQACMNYAGQPLPNYEQQGRQGGGFRGSAGLLLSATGLVTTVAASTFALSASGTIAIIAASAAGLFSFKLSKVWPTHRRADGAPPRIAMLSAPRPVVLL